jgi:oxalate decarboxylase
MKPFARRSLLSAVGTAGAASIAHAASYGNPDSPPQGSANFHGTGPGFPGPRNPGLESQFPSFAATPSTDVSGLPLFWASFNVAHPRVQDGGWAREVTQKDFAISKDIAGVNMRLQAGAIRELHWHQQAEWAVVTNGVTRITVLDELGRPQVADVPAGALWYIPAGLPHSLQGMGPDGAEFILAFDSGTASENSTLLVTDWFAHTPPDVLAKNFGLPAEAFKNIPLSQRWIFPGKTPGSLSDDQAAAQGRSGTAASPHDFTFNLGAMAPNKKTRSGQIQIADSSNFPASATVAAAMVTVKPGGMREMHWHPNADEWQYYVRGAARMTVFNTGPKAMTVDFRAGDVGYVEKSLGHYIENTGKDDLVFFEIFKTHRYMEISLSDWLQHTPPAMVAATLNLDPADVARLSKDSPGIVPV